MWICKNRFQSFPFKLRAIRNHVQSFIIRIYFYLTVYANLLKRKIEKWKQRRRNYKTDRKILLGSILWQSFYRFYRDRV